LGKKKKENPAEKKKTPDYRGDFYAPYDELKREAARLLRGGGRKNTRGRENSPGPKRGTGK